MNNLLNISTIFLPKAILLRTLNKCQEKGQTFQEVCVLWVGKIHESNCSIKDVWIPSQKSTFISFEIDPVEIHQLNFKLSEINLVGIAQIHTHPEEAYHSEIDDECPILYLPGSFSIVLPNFGSISADDLEKWKVYRLENEIWNELTQKKVKEIFQII